MSFSFVDLSKTRIVSKRKELSMWRSFPRDDTNTSCANFSAMTFSYCARVRCWKVCGGLHVTSHRRNAPSLEGFRVAPCRCGQGHHWTGSVWLSHRACCGGKWHHRCHRILCTFCTCPRLLRTWRIEWLIDLLLVKKWGEAEELLLGNYLKLSNKLKIYIWTIETST